MCGKTSARLRKQLRELQNSGRHDPGTIGQIEELQWKLDSRNFGHKRNKKKK